MKIRSCLLLALLALVTGPVTARSQTDTPPSETPAGPTADTLDASVVMDEAREEINDSGATIVITDAADTLVISKDTSEVRDRSKQDSPEDRGFLIVASDGKSSLRIRGSVRLNGGFDFEGLQQADFFDTYLIPVGHSSSTEPRFFMSATQSRFGIEATRGTELGDAFIRIETDFRGQPDHLHLRHAYATLRYVLMGQTWSGFSDVSGLPLTVDFDGPNSAITKRTAQVRYGREFTRGLQWVLTAEAPDADIRVPDSVAASVASQSTPDLAGRLRKNAGWGHAQLAGILRSISLRDTAANTEVLVGWGVLTSLQWLPSKRNELLFQMEIGEGIAGYIGSLEGRGLDAVYSPATDSWELLPVLGAFISLGHDWTDAWLSYVTVGFTAIENAAFQPPEAFRRSTYFSANLFVEPGTGIRSGLEYTQGRRENKDGQHGWASRLSFIMQYDF